jgi:hypothetical protein
MNGYRKCGVYIHIEYYSAIKKSEIMSFAGKWLELENILLSNINQTQKTKYPMFSLMYRI